MSQASHPRLDLNQQSFCMVLRASMEFDWRVIACLSYVHVLPLKRPSCGQRPVPLGSILINPKCCITYELWETERRTGSQFSIPADRTNNGEFIIQICSDSILLINSTNFSPKMRPTLTSFRAFVCATLGTNWIHYHWPPSNVTIHTGGLKLCLGPRPFLSPYSLWMHQHENRL